MYCWIVRVSNAAGHGFLPLKCRARVSMRSRDIDRFPENDFSMTFADDEVALLPSRVRPLRIGTLVGLRWLAIVGQAIGVIFVDFGLGYPLPLMECLG
jgi:hypothetical protein